MPSRLSMCRVATAFVGVEVIFTRSIREHYCQTLQSCEAGLGRRFSSRPTLESATRAGKSELADPAPERAQARRASSPIAPGSWPEGFRRRRTPACWGAVGSARFAAVSRSRFKVPWLIAYSAAVAVTRVGRAQVGYHPQSSRQMTIRQWQMRDVMTLLSRWTRQPLELPASGIELSVAAVQGRRRGLVSGAYTLALRSRSALPITEIELAAMAALATIGLSSSPSHGYRTPAATGTPRKL